MNRRRTVWGIWMCCFAIVLTGCTAKAAHFEYPKPSDFTVTMELKDWTPVAGETFAVKTELQNRSDRSVVIHHGAPLIHLKLAADDWEEHFPKVNLVVDVAATIEKHNSYDPDTKNFVEGKRVLTIEDPGDYSLVAVATFLVYHPNGKDYKEYEIVSSPHQLEVFAADPEE